MPRIADLVQLGFNPQQAKHIGDGLFYDETTGTSVDVFNIVPGEYTPTTTNVTNISSSSAGLTTWSRNGDYITVAGSVTFDPTAAGYCALTIDLPVTINNFSSTTQANGTCNGEKGGATVGSLVVSSVNGAKTVRISGYVTYTDNTDHRFIFMYKIIQ